MPNTKLTKPKLKAHFQYAKKIYIVIALVALLLGDLVFAVTRYQSPNERKVDIQMVGPYADTSEIAELTDYLLAAGQAHERKRDEAEGIDTSAPGYEVPLEEIGIMSLEYSGTSDDYYGAQKYMVMVAAGEGDIYVCSRSIMTDLVDGGIAVDLEPYIESGVLDPGDRDLSRVTFATYYDPDLGEEKPEKEHSIYALQADALTGLIEGMSYNPADCYLVVTQFSKNQDTAVAVLQGLMDYYTPGEEAQSEG